MNKNNTDTTEGLITKLKEAGYYVDILWHARDIQLLCEQENLPKPNLVDCQQIFALFTKRFDGEHGLSWPLLRAVVYEYHVSKKGFEQNKIYA